MALKISPRGHFDQFQNARTVPRHKPNRADRYATQISDQDRAAPIENMRLWIVELREVFGFDSKMLLNPSEVQRAERGPV